LPPGAVIYSMGLDDQSARTLPVEVAALNADAVTLDALARLQLAARRCGFELRLRGSSSELRELIGFAGLNEVLPEDEPLGLEAGR
jgi:hypothetical protein